MMDMRPVKLERHLVRKSLSDRYHMYPDVMLAIRDYTEQARHNSDPMGVDEMSYPGDEEHDGEWEEVYAVGKSQGTGNGQQKRQRALEGHRQEPDREAVEPGRRRAGPTQVSQQWRKMSNGGPMHQGKDEGPRQEERLQSARRIRSPSGRRRHRIWETWSSARSRKSRELVPRKLLRTVGTTSRQDLLIST